LDEKDLIKMKEKIKIYYLLYKSIY
jgi:hypothetical protein